MNGSRFIMVLAWMGWLMFCQTLVASGEPFRPTDDRLVLERLSFNPTNPVAREIRALRSSLAKNPRHLESAVHLATRYIELSRSEGDPRFLGQAEAILAPWWQQSNPPPPALLLRATIKQNAHEFDSALVDLDEVLSMQPSNAQAWLTKASILTVQANYDDARRACQPLARLTGRHVFLACLADIAGATGESAKSQIVLRELLDHPRLSASERVWISVMLGEIAARTGDAQTADRSFSEILKTGVKNQYLLGTYADFLLDRGRHRDVVNLLQHETRADGLLLRLAIAEQALNLASFRDHVATLISRFAASRDRGTNVHVREEARFTLVLLGNPRQALPLAQMNWKVQREPADARILLESALAAGNRDAAKPVLDWLSINHVEDRRLQHLAKLVQQESR
jgi:tetratricopeptide (TPR) repeat protein